jgi:hypothetical protein
MFRDIKEFEKLQRNEDILWYFKVKDSNKFDVLKARTLTFADEFEGDRLDTDKWLTNYYWGDNCCKTGILLREIYRYTLKGKTL